MALKIAIAASSAAAAALLAALFWPAPGGQGAPPPGLLSANERFEPAAAAFGDTVSARLSVVIDNGVLDPSTLRVTFPLAPLATVGRTVRHRVDRGDATTITYTAAVACLDEACVGKGESVAVSPAAPSISVERRSGGTARVAASRSSLTVDRRVGAAAAGAAVPRFRGDLGAPRVSYRVSASALIAILAILATVLAALGGGLVAAGLSSRSRAAARSARGSELERALALVRSSEARSAEDRRRAVGLVARLLARRDGALARVGDDLAWSQPPPTGESATGFADEVERGVAP